MGTGWREVEPAGVVLADHGFDGLLVLLGSERIEVDLVHIGYHNQVTIISWRPLTKLHLDNPTQTLLQDHQVLFLSEEPVLDVVERHPLDRRPHDQRHIVIRVLLVQLLRVESHPPALESSHIAGQLVYVQCHHSRR